MALYSDEVFMKITRRQFSIGCVASLLALIFGRFFTGCKQDKPEIKTKKGEARYWKTEGKFAG